MDSPSPLQVELSSLLGVNVEIRSATGPSRSFDLRLSGVDRPHGFRVRVRRMLSWVDASLEFDSLARELQNTLQDVISTSSDQTQDMLKSFELMGVEYLERPSLSAQAGRQPSGTLLASRVMLDDSQPIDRATRIAAESVLIPAVQLLGLEASRPSLEFTEAQFDEEGSTSQILSRQHERSPVNRAIAIELHGRDCIICGFSFDQYYGILAAGYVEVHHLLPVSMMETPSVVNPQTDLVPLCANCHRAVHRRWPPYTPEEVRRAITTEAGFRNGQRG